jgi:uncharacterized protein (DUF58 family)
MVRRYRVKVNRAGVFFTGVTIFLGVSAVNTSNNLLYFVVSFLLSFMLLSGMLSLYNLKGLSLELIPPKEVYAQKAENFKLILKNQKRFPSFTLLVEAQGSRAFFPILEKEEVGFITLKFPRRGYYDKLSVRVSSSFPVGLFERFFHTDVPVNLVVYPYPMAVSKRIRVEGLQRGEWLTVGRRRGYEHLHSVREYMGEPVKLIHWKLSAKVGKLYVKDFLAEESPPVVLSLDMVEGTIEDKLSKLSYLVLEYSKRGTPVGLRLDGTYLEPALGEEHKRKMLRELALFGDSPGVRA